MRKVRAPPPESALLETGSDDCSLAQPRYDNQAQSITPLVNHIHQGISDFLIHAFPDFRIYPTRGGNQIYPTRGGNHQIYLTRDGNQIYPTGGGNQIHTTRGGNQLYPTRGGNQIHSGRGGNQIYPTRGGLLIVSILPTFSMDPAIAWIGCLKQDRCTIRILIALSMLLNALEPLVLLGASTKYFGALGQGSASMKRAKPSAPAPKSLPSSPSPPRSPLRQLPRGFFDPRILDPRLDPVRNARSRFHAEFPPATLSSNARWQFVPRAPDPHPARDLENTNHTWEQLAIDLEGCEWDIDTIIAPIHPICFADFSQFYVLAGTQQLETNNTNFPAGMVITVSPWTIILTLDFHGTPKDNGDYAKALHAVAKQLCRSLGDRPGSSKLEPEALPDDADAPHKCLTRSQGISIHADALAHAFHQLAENGGVPFQLYICRYALKAIPEDVYGPLMCMYAKLGIEASKTLEEEYKEATVLHVGVDFPSDSGHLVLAKAYSHQRFWEGQPCNFSHYPYLGKLGQGFGGITLTVKDMETCESCVSGFTYYTGALKRKLLASKVPVRKWLGLHNDQQSIARLQSEFDEWRSGLVEGSQIANIGGARLELYTTCGMRNWKRHQEFLLPVFTKILQSMSFKLVRASDFVQQFDDEYQVAKECGCFTIHGAHNDPAEIWKQLGCHRLRMLIGWSFSPESKGAYLAHKAGIPFKDLVNKPSRSNLTVNMPKSAPPMVATPFFPKRRNQRIADGVPQQTHPSLEELWAAHHAAEEQEEPVQPPVRKHKYQKIADDLFSSIGFPLLRQARSAGNCMNQLPVPAVGQWRTLVTRLSGPGDMFANTNCTGEALHELATQVEWRGAPMGRSTNAHMAWGCKPLVSGLHNTSGCLGYSLGEAVPNLWLKIRIEGFTPCRKTRVGNMIAGRQVPFCINVPSMDKATVMIFHSLHIYWHTLRSHQNSF